MQIFWLCWCLVSLTPAFTRANCTHLPDLQMYWGKYELSPIAWDLLHIKGIIIDNSGSSSDNNDIPVEISTVAPAFLGCTVQPPHPPVTPSHSRRSTPPLWLPPLWWPPLVHWPSPSWSTQRWRSPSSGVRKEWSWAPGEHSRTHASGEVGT